MRYCTWKLTWSEDYGYGPEQTAHDNGGALTPSMWVNPSVEAGLILGYATEGLDLSLLAAWEVTELTEAEALAFAQNLDATAYFMDDGIIARVEPPEDI
jgi:hypothetical protein